MNFRCRGSQASCSRDSGDQQFQKDLVRPISKASRVTHFAAWQISAEKFPVFQIPLENRFWQRYDPRWRLFCRPAFWSKVDTLANSNLPSRSPTHGLATRVGSTVSRLWQTTACGPSRVKVAAARALDVSSRAAHLRWTPGSVHLLGNAVCAGPRPRRHRSARRVFFRAASSVATDTMLRLHVGSGKEFGFRKGSCYG